VTVLGAPQARSSGASPGKPDATFAYAAIVAKIVVDVMLKPEIRDPQGEAIAGACHRLGFGEVLAVRQGKRFEVEVADSEAADADALASRMTELSAELLANPVIEEFEIRGT
jgi:phosphoribosylformylglycinamidine synthase PurS subunit